MKKSLSIPLGIVICLLIGFASRPFHETAMLVWYPALQKSVLTPPDIVFPIVWGILYVLMGISVGLLYQANDVSSKKILLWLFAVQLLLNVCWNISFFYLRNPILGFVNLLILDVLATVFFFSALSEKRSVAFFFLPYLIWMFFTLYLNWYIVFNN